MSVLHEMLAHHIGRRTKGNEDWQTPIPDLLFFRREELSGPCACRMEPSVVLVVQGAKQMFLGGEAYLYDPGHFLITSLDLPGGSQVIAGSPDKPCLGLAMKLDLQIVTELIAERKVPLAIEGPIDRGMGIGTVTPLLLEPFKRLLDLLDEPSAIAALAPLIQQEIHFRLLMSDQAARLWQIASVGSQGHRVAEAIDWLKDNYSLSLRIDDLAERVQMSSSNFRRHFRQLTAMTPLQYQKWLRLSEARRLMLNDSLDAADAAFHVGYESPSQFSREYRRLFGSPPRRDIEGLRHKVDNAVLSEN